MLRIALAGAPGTGKSRLLSDLQPALEARAQQVQASMESFSTPHPDLVLLMGVDGGSAEQHSADLALRASFADAGLPYHVIYGTSAERLAQALAMIDAQLGRPALTPATSSRPWVWVCDKCSDPKCEHALLTGLLAARSGKTDSLTAP